MKWLATLVLGMFGLVALADEPRSIRIPLNPGQALEEMARLRPLASDVQYQPHPAEAELRDWLASGTLSESQWADAFLIASGECDAEQRQKWLAKIDATTESLRAECEGLQGTKLAEAILQHLHRTDMKKGYVESQSSLPVLLETGEFNCVSSTVAYWIQGQRLKQPMQIMEFPGSKWEIGHVMVMHLEGSRQIDIETTNADGYDVRAKIQSSGGTAFGIKDLKYGRAIDPLGLVLTVYNNRATTASKEGRLLDGLLLRHTMWSFDPMSADLQTGLVNGFVNWVYEQTEKGGLDEALTIGKVGLTIAPDDEDLRKNVKVAHSQTALALIRKGEDREVVNLYEKAIQAWPTHGFQQELALAYTLAAQSEREQSGWGSAIEILKRGLSLVHDSTEADTSEVTPTSNGTEHDSHAWKSIASKELLSRIEEYYRGWSVSALEEKEFERSAQILHDAVQSMGEKSGLMDAVGYLGQESFAFIDREQGPEALMVWKKALATQFPKAESLENAAQYHLQCVIDSKLDSLDYVEAHRVIDARQQLVPKEISDNHRVRIWDHEASRFAEKGDWEKAHAIYRLALQQLPDHPQLLHNAPLIYDQQARPFMENKNWKEAIGIYDLGLKVFADNWLLKTNRAYCEQYLPQR